MRDSHRRTWLPALMAAGLIATSASCQFAVAPDKPAAASSAGIPAHTSETAPDQTPPAAASSPAATSIFVCSEEPGYVVSSTSEEAWVFLPSHTVRLPRVRTASGEKFSDGAVDLWMKGDEASFGETGGAQHTCQNDRQRAVWEKAKLSGVDFRAVGNEPGWTLEIQRGTKMVLVADYGQTTVQAALPNPIEDTEARSTRWETSEFTVEAFAHPCQDVMSGEEFESEVRIRWNGKTLSGCGRALH